MHGGWGNLEGGTRNADTREDLRNRFSHTALQPREIFGHVMRDGTTGRLVPVALLVLSVSFLQHLFGKSTCSYLVNRWRAV